MAKTIRQTRRFRAPPHAIYEAILDSARHTAFTGANAKIVRRVGGKVSAFDGWATGKILELRRDAKIVQTWRSEDFKDDEPDSILTLTLQRTGRGSRLMMVHRRVPDREYEAVRQGWIDYYWVPLKEYLEPAATSPQL